MDLRGCWVQPLRSQTTPPDLSPKQEGDKEDEVSNPTALACKSQHRAGGAPKRVHLGSKMPEELGVQGNGPRALGEELPGVG